LIRVAGIWFLLGQTATVAANSYHVPSRPFALVAIGIFFIHSFLVICETSPSKGASRSLYSGLVTFLIVATFNLLSLRITQGDDFEALQERLSRMSEDVSYWVRGTDQAFRNMQTVEHLSSASRLIFHGGSRLSLKQARTHLRRIPPNSKEYSSAQGLLLITELRMAELDYPGGPRTGKKPLIEITDRNQNKERLRITLRNNGAKPVEKIRYKVSYFDMATGLQTELETEGMINELVEGQTSTTVDIHGGDVLKGQVYAAFIIQGWETVSGS
jgi:hypothetical protein